MAIKVYGQSMAHFKVKVISRLTRTIANLFHMISNVQLNITSSKTHPEITFLKMKVENN